MTAMCAAAWATYLALRGSQLVGLGVDLRNRLPKPFWRDESSALSRVVSQSAICVPCEPNWSGEVGKLTNDPYVSNLRPYRSQTALIL